MGAKYKVGRLGIPLIGGVTNNLGAGPEYMMVQGGGAPIVAEPQRFQLIPHDGMIRNFRIWLPQQPGVGNTRQFIVRINGVNTVLVINATGAQNAFNSGALGPVAVAQDDRITLMQTVTGGAPPATTAAHSLDYIPDTKILSY